MPILERHWENRLTPGTQVEVWVQFDRSWTDGFEIADLTSDGYLVRRRTDGSVLPRALAEGSVRAAHD